MAAIETLIKLASAHYEAGFAKGLGFRVGPCVVWQPFNSDSDSSCRLIFNLNLGHFQVGSYRYRSLKEGLYTLQKPYRSPIDPKLPACSFL